tara:strand:+ start:56 stop:352 length:297 start_codon:yes stop_codon:yes gene_type:complete
VPKKNLKKKDIIDSISYKTGFPKNFSSKILDDLLYIINLNINNGDLILKNLGSFKKIEKNERIGRNPKTKKEYKIHARKSIKFTPALKISKRLNKSYE